MFCSRCGKPVPTGAAFCPACGSPVATPAAARPVAPIPQPGPRPTPQPASAPTGARPAALQAAPMAGVAADFEAQKRKTRLTAAGIGVAALIAAFFGARALGLLRLGASTPQPGIRIAAKGPPSALQMPGEVPPPVLAEKGSTAPPPLQENATRAQMPEDVRDWLNHLQECERRKVALASDQNAEAMVAATKLGGMGGAMNFLNNEGEVDPGSDENKDASLVGKEKILAFRPPWDQLVAFFNSKTPPAECAPLASNYNRALSELGGSMGDIADLLNGASKDPAKALKSAYAMKGKSTDQIDKFFSGASQKYGDICQKYDTKPWFEIKSDVTMGGNLGIFGNLAMAAATRVWGSRFSKPKLVNPAELRSWPRRTWA